MAWASERGTRNSWDIFICNEASFVFFFFNSLRKVTGRQTSATDHCVISTKRILRIRIELKRETIEGRTTMMSCARCGFQWIANATLAIFQQQQMISNKIKTTNLTHITYTILVRDLAKTCVIIHFRFFSVFSFAFFAKRDVSRFFDDNCKAYASDRYLGKRAEKVKIKNKQKNKKNPLNPRKLGQLCGYNFRGIFSVCFD